MISGRVVVDSSPYYNGRRSGIELDTEWRPNPLFNISLSNDLTLVELGGVEEWVYLQRVSANLQFSSDLVWSVLAQYDNVSGEVGINSRIRWTYRAGSDIFLIFNQG